MRRPILGLADQQPRLPTKPMPIIVKIRVALELRLNAGGLLDGSASEPFRRPLKGPGRE